MAALDLCPHGCYWSCEHRDLPPEPPAWPREMERDLERAEVARTEVAWGRSQRAGYQSFGCP